MTREPPRAATLAAVLARALPDAKPGAIAHAVGAMIAAAKAHKRWGEACCNYPMTDAQQRRGDKRCERLAHLAIIAVAAASPGTYAVPSIGELRATPDGPHILRITFGGDPRGPCGMLHVSDMPGDGFGPGWAIYE